MNAAFSRNFNSTQSQRMNWIMSVKYFFTENCIEGHRSLKFTASTMIYIREYLTTQCTGIWNYREKKGFYFIGSEISKKRTHWNRKNVFSVLTKGNAKCVFLGNLVPGPSSLTPSFWKSSRRRPWERGWILKLLRGSWQITWFAWNTLVTYSTHLMKALNACSQSRVSCCLPT